MAGNLTDAAEALLLDFLLTPGAAQRPTAWAVALFTTAPGEAGGGTELTAGTAPGYSRQSVAFAPAANGQTGNTGEVVFTATGGGWPQVTHLKILATAPVQRELLYAPLVKPDGVTPDPKTLADRDSLVFAVGELSVSLD
jgi:hypothetical protein